MYKEQGYVEARQTTTTELNLAAVRKISTTN
jgi:hypothetical protein